MATLRAHAEAKAQWIVETWREAGASDRVLCIAITEAIMEYAMRPHPEDKDDVP